MMNFGNKFRIYLSGLLLIIALISCLMWLQKELSLEAITSLFTILASINLEFSAKVIGKNCQDTV